MNKILVLGGTGAMGTHLVEVIAQRGDKVVVTTRTKRKSFENVEYIQGNARDINFLGGLLSQEWDAIVDFMVYTTTSFEQRAAKLLANTKQYVYLSSARVYADSREPLKENYPRLLDNSNDTQFLKTDEYSLAKARQEDILHESGSNNWTIIRPYITYSEQRLQLGVLEKEAWLYRALQGRTIVFSDDIATKLSTLTYGLDVATAMAALIGESNALGQTYHITQSQAVSWSQVLEIYLNVLEKRMGRRPNVLLLGLQDFVRCHKSEHQIRYDRLFNRSFDNSKVSEFVDIDRFLSTEEGLARCLEKFLENPRFERIDWRAEAIKDRFAGDKTNIMSIDGLKNKVKYLIIRYIKSKKANL